MAVNSGTVRMFKDDRGFGFLRPDDGGRDIFFLVKTAIAGGISEPKPGMRVEFDVEVTERGPRAASLREIIDAG